MSVPSNATRRIIYVTAGFPFPLWSGYLRHNFLIRELAATHHITLLSLVGPSYVAEHAEAMAPWVDRVETFPHGGEALVWRAGRSALPADWPPPSVRALCRAVERELSSQPVDAVVLTGKDTTPVLDVLQDHHVPLVVDLCDATSTRYEQLADAAGSVRGLPARRRARNASQRERRLLDAADVALVASDRDRAALLSTHPGARLAVSSTVTMPNGIDADHWSRSRPQLGSAVAFCGNLAYAPNDGAARRLVNDIMPRVWAVRPGAELRLIGRYPHPDLVELAAGLPVVITGEVDDVRPHLESAAVFAAPLHAATGIQNKVLEAMAMEIPVVGSTCAAAGLKIDGHAPPILVADDDGAIADAIVERLDAAALDPQPDLLARRWVCERFVWARSGRALADAIGVAVAVGDRAAVKEVSSC